MVKLCSIIKVKKIVGLTRNVGKIDKSTFTILINEWLWLKDKFYLIAIQFGFFADFEQSKEKRE